MCLELYYLMKQLGKKTTLGKKFPEYLNEIGIIPGIKVDTGAKPLSCHQNEKNYRRFG